MTFPSAATLNGHNFDSVDGAGYLFHQWMGDVGDVLNALAATYQPLDSDLTAIAALSTTSYGRAFLALADAAAARTALSLGTAAQSATTDFDAAGAAAAAQSASQPLDSDLTAIAALSTTSFGRSVLTAANAAALATLAGLGNVDNTSDATKNAAAVTLTNKTLTSPVVNSPTGIVKGDVGLGNVDNTSNVTERAASATLTNKTLTSPVINTGVSGTAVDTDATMAANSDTILASQKATKTALALKAPLASPTFTGTPAAPTASPGTNTTQVATTAYADAIGALKQPLDSDLTTIAGLTATTDNFMVAAGSAWASRTPTQAKASLAIAESDVTNLVTDLGALQTQASIQQAQMNAVFAANLGFYVGTGCTYSASGTAGKLDDTSGIVALGTTDVNAAAETAIGSDVATLGTALTSGQAMWVNVEKDPSGVTQYNAGSAATAALAAIPATTAGRTIAGWMYIPFTAVALNAIDLLPLSSNDKAKFIPVGISRPSVPSPTGWQYEQGTWTWVSSWVFKVSGVDATSWLRPGTLVSMVNNSVTCYFVIGTSTFSTDTTVTLITTHDYMLVNSAITFPRYAKGGTGPKGFPTKFGLDITYTGCSQNPSSTALITGVSSTIASSKFTKTSHGLTTGVALSPGAGLSTTTGVAVGTTYWVIVLNANDFQLATTKANALATTPITLGGSTDASISFSNMSNQLEWWQGSVGIISLDLRNSTAGTSNSATHSFSLPFTAVASSVAAKTLAGAVTDNNLALAGGGNIAQTGTVGNVFVFLAGVPTNTSSGTHRANNLLGSYPFATAA